MGRSGNPCDNPQAKSFMKTLKVEAVRLAEHEKLDEVAADLPRFIDGIHDARRLHSALGHLSPIQFEDRNARTPVKTAACNASGALHPTDCLVRSLGVREPSERFGAGGLNPTSTCAA